MFENDISLQNLAWKSVAHTGFHFGEVKPRGPGPHVPLALLQFSFNFAQFTVHCENAPGRAPKLSVNIESLKN